MNAFGRNLRVQIFGESHGVGVGVILDGAPAGIPLSDDDFIADIARRQGGTQLGVTPRKEEDKVEFLSGCFNSRTTGAPLTLFFRNTNIRSRDYAEFLNVPRPGHADWVATQKFGGFNDYRGGGHFSGRLTLPLVAAGVVAKKIIPQIAIKAWLLELGGERDIAQGVAKALSLQDSVGGVVACEAQGIPVGLGEPFFASVESVLAGLLFAIPAVKAVGFGSGFRVARMLGTEHNDAIVDATGKTKTNNSGGINGGITNGNPLYFELTIKPASSTPKAQESLHLRENKVLPFRVGGRHDLCIALRVPVVAEAVCALVLADFWLAECGRQNWAQE